MTNPSHFLLTILPKNYGKKSKLVNRNAISQEAPSTTNSLTLPQLRHKQPVSILFGRDFYVK